MDQWREVYSESKPRNLSETVHSQHDMVRASGKSHFDVVIIGAGINGAGIARDASMRGLKVLLVEKNDVGSGASSASTRLIHGGLRYLEHFEFGLVRESLRERETLLKIAPHLVRPLPITIPIYKRSKRGRLTVRAGMIAYDLLSGDTSLPSHRMLSRKKTLEQSPGLNPEGLLGSALYFDAQVEFAERLVLENIIAAQKLGAEIFTHTRVTNLLSDSEKVTGVEFLSEGGVHFASADVIVNAAGPWIDELLDRIDFASPRLLGGTKGSHIVVPTFPGASTNAIYLEARSDRRPLFIIPWNKNYLIGTTDVSYDGNPDRVHTELWEIDYLLAETNLAFPSAQLTRDDILYTYSGIRPLPLTGEREEEKITRRHFIREHPHFANLLSIVGGKLTTYRSLSEECVDLIFRKFLGKKSPPCLTATEPLPGALNFVGELSGELGAIRERLWRVYGRRANDVIQLAMSDKDLAKPFNKAGDALAAEIVFAFKHELAQTLADCFFRRTMIGLNGDLGLGDLKAAAGIGMQFLGWSEARARREIESYENEISRRLTPINADQRSSAESTAAFIRARESRAKRF